MATHHVYDIEWPEHGEALSVVVLETGEGTLLFGGGDEGMGETLVSVAREHGVSVVVVEHGDADHYGGVPRLVEALDLEVAIPAADAGALEAVGVEPDYRLSPGETFRGVEAIGAPGHTRGNLAYRHGDVLIAGDTVCGADSAFAADGDWSGPLAAITPEYNWDDERARESVAGLLDHDFEAVLVAHGSDVYEDGRDAVETLTADLESDAGG